MSWSVENSYYRSISVVSNLYDCQKHSFESLHDTQQGQTYDHSWNVVICLLSIYKMYSKLFCNCSGEQLLTGLNESTSWKSLNDPPIYYSRPLSTWALMLIFQILKCCQQVSRVRFYYTGVPLREISMEKSLSLVGRCIGWQKHFKFETSNVLYTW